jgi:DNA polymerase III subunit chi
MTRIDFYVLPSEGADDAVMTACKLCDKAVNAGQRVYVHAPADADRDAIDKLLWTMRQGSFIAHERLGVAPLEEPLPAVLLGDAEPPASHNGVLINLGNSVPPFFSRFDRVLEVVATGESRASSRERYKFYRDRGYELKSYEQQSDGSWKARQ